MENGPAKNLRQMPGRLANQNEKKWLLSPHGSARKSGSVKKKNKRKRNKSKISYDSGQPSVKTFLERKSEFVDSADGLQGEKEEPKYFELPVKIRIKKLEQGYLTDPEMEIRCSKESWARKDNGVGSNTNNADTEISVDANEHSGHFLFHSKRQLNFEEPVGEDANCNAPVQTVCLLRESPFLCPVSDCNLQVGEVITAEQTQDKQWVEHPQCQYIGGCVVPRDNTCGYQLPGGDRILTASQPMNTSTTTTIASTTAMMSSTTTSTVFSSSQHLQHQQQYAGANFTTDNMYSILIQISGQIADGNKQTGVTA